MRQLSGIDVTFLNMETSTTYGHVSSLNIYDPTGVPGGAGVEAMKQLILERIDQLAPFRRRLVEVPLGTRPAVLDRGSRLRHRLPRPPPRGRAARNSRAARRGDQPHPRAPTRSSTPALGAVRHRRCRWWPTDRPAHQGPPRRDRRRGRGAHARRDPRHRSRRPSHGRATPVVARQDPDRSGAAAADARRVRAAAREADPPVGAVVAGAGGVDAGRRTADPRRSHRPADAGTARIADAHAPPARLRVRGRPAAAPATDGRAANAVEPVDLTSPAVRLHHDRARVGEAGAAGDRLHVQRRRDGDLLRDAAALPR